MPVVQDSATPMSTDPWDARAGDEVARSALAGLADELRQAGLPGAEIRERQHLQPLVASHLEGCFPGHVRSGRVLPLDDFQPRVGGFDVRVDRTPGGSPAWLAELKWSYSRPDKIFEAAWDAVKLALARHQYAHTVTRCWLITGASDEMWADTETGDLFAEGEIDVAELWVRPLTPRRSPNSGNTVGEDLEIGGGDNMFVRCPRLSISTVAQETIVLSDGTWTLKAAAVEPIAPWIDPFPRIRAGGDPANP